MAELFPGIKTIKYKVMNGPGIVSKVQLNEGDAGRIAGTIRGWVTEV